MVIDFLEVKKQYDNADAINRQYIIYGLVYGYNVPISVIADGLDIAPSTIKKLFPVAYKHR